LRARHFRKKASAASAHNTLPPFPCSSGEIKIVAVKIVRYRNWQTAKIIRHRFRKRNYLSLGSLLYFAWKAVDFTCTGNGSSSCIWSTDGLDNRVAFVKSNGGTSTFTGISFRDGNTEYSNGGGLMVDGSTVVLVLCEVMNNHAQSGDAYGHGGGVKVKGAATTTFTGCTFNGNSAAWGNDVYADGVGATATSEGCPVDYGEVKGEELGTFVYYGGDITGDLHSFECTKSLGSIA